MTRIVILSVAHMHAYGYAKALQEMKNVEILGVYDEDTQRAEVFLSKTGVPVLKANDPQMQNADAFVVCSENANHLQYIQWAVQFGKPILCEKPLGATVVQGRSILNVVNAANVPLYMALPARFLTSVQKLRSAVLEGHIGRVMAMTGTNHGSVPGGWFLDASLSGGGAVADHVPHVVDLMSWITGKRVVEVYAEIGKPLFSGVIDDFAVITMTWSDGTFSTLDPSWSRILGVYPEWGDVTLEIVGTQGVVMLDAFAQKIDRYQAGAPTHRFIHYGDDMDQLMIREFVDCVREGRPSDRLASGDDGLHALYVTAAAYESAKLGKPVSTASLM